MKAIKIRVTEEQSAEDVQKYLYSQGYSWDGKGDVVSLTNVVPLECGFYGHAGGTMGWDYEEAFNDTPITEVFLPKNPTEDAVNNPKHYTSHPSGFQCLDVTRHMSFNLGNATKYIWRCDLKKDAIEDLRKAIFYLNDEINLRLSKKQC